MTSKTNRGQEFKNSDAAVTIQLGHGIGDISGEWIDAIWEAGDEEPTQGSHIRIESAANGFKVSGTTYSAPRFGEVGHFESTGTIISSTADGFAYVYNGMERARLGGPKYHNGVGFYVFRNSGDFRTFTGAFTAWEEDRNRRVEGRQLNDSEKSAITKAASRNRLFRTFLTEKKERARAELISAFDKVFSKRLLDILTRYDLDQAVNELKSVWGRHPLCMALLLRTILEKMLTKALLRQEAQFDEGAKFKTMIDLAMSSRRKGSNDPILTRQTGEAVHTMRFLGNTAAHSGYARIDLETVIDFAPRINTAIDELSRSL